MHLPEHVDAKAYDNNGSNADTTRARLNGLEDEEANRGNDGSEPGNETVDETARKRGRENTQHADKAKESYDEANRETRIS